MLQDNESAKRKENEAAMANDLEKSGIIQDAETTKSQKTAGKKQTANDLEKSGEAVKKGLTTSEKALVSQFNEEAGRLLVQLVGGRISGEAIRERAKNALMREVKSLYAAGAKESAVVLGRSFVRLFGSSNSGLSLESVRFYRTRTQNERKAAKLAKETAANREKIEAFSAEYGIPAEKVTQMFEAGKLKL